VPGTAAPESPSNTAPQTALPTLYLPSTTSEIFKQTALRATHIIAIAIWLLGVGMLVLGSALKWSMIAAVVGIGGVVGTGILLILLGTPLTYPGLFRWQELSQRFYGLSYQTAFVLKMVGVAIAVIGTATAVATKSKVSGWTVGAGVTIAAVAVTARGQFHLFAHL
jgi:hypothetical protein